MVAKRFEDLVIWQKSRDFAKMIYALTRTLTFAKDYGLKDQLQRAVVSVSSNVAEGFERNGNAEFANFHFIANGSCGEVRSQLYIAYDLNYIMRVQFDEAVSQSVELSKMIYTFIKSLKSSSYLGIKKL